MRTRIKKQLVTKKIEQVDLTRFKKSSNTSTERVSLDDRIKNGYQKLFNDIFNYSTKGVK